MILARSNGALVLEFGVTCERLTTGKHETDRPQV